RALQGLEVFGGADHAPIAAFGFDLLLDVLDLGPDLREAITRLLWGLLWKSPLAGFALGHGRSPCDGSVGKRRLSAGMWEKRNPAPRHRFFRIAPTCPPTSRRTIPGLEREKGIFCKMRCIASSRIWNAWPCNCRWSRNSDLSVPLTRAR